MKKMNSILAVVSALAIAGSVSAAIWTDGGADNLWTNAANWDTGVPGSGEDILIDDNGPGAFKAPGNDASGLGSMDVGLDNTGVLQISGAVAGGDMQIGHNAGAVGTVEVLSGDGSFGGWNSLATWNLTLADVGGDGTLINEGGTIHVYGDWFNLAPWGGTASVQLNGGHLIVDATNFYVGAGGTIDLAGGTLVLAGNQVGVLTDLIDSGQLTSHGTTYTAATAHEGFVRDYDGTHAGYTTVKGFVPHAATTVNWTDAGADGLWTTITNWDVGVPTPGDIVMIDNGTAALMKGVPWNLIDTMNVGFNNTGAVTLAESSINVPVRVAIADNGGSAGSLTIMPDESAVDSWHTIDTTALRIGENGGEGSLTNNGGTIKVWSTWFNLAAWAGSGTAHAQLNGGTILSEGIHIGAGGSIDFAGGTLVVAGDLSNDPTWGDLFAQWVSLGQFTAYGVTNDISKFNYDYGVTSNGYTTISAVPPSQSPMDLYMEWAAGAGLDTNGSNSATTFDVEPDGMDNLLEYALGGNPLVDDAASIQPTSEFIDADTWEYVYNRRLDATSRGLAYDIVAKLNLLDPAWTHSGGSWETNATPVDAFFESVSNIIPSTNDKGFIKLEVEASF